MEARRRSHDLPAHGGPPQVGSGAASAYLKSIGAGVRKRYVENRTLLSFEAWMEDFLRDPLRQARSSAQYLRDALDHFGTREVETPLGKVRRFRLFDLEFDGGVGAVHGQEEAQNAIYRILGNFVQAGRANKLILLHGPNGSAKSSLVAALARGLEVYSRTPEGAMYRINWIFPGEKLNRGAIGFGESEGAREEPTTFAHLDGEEIDATLACEMKDHPVFLIPHGERKKLLEEAAERRPGFVLPETILEGELCHKCRQVYARLLRLYGGDFLQVLRHVQVERFFISRRYLVGAVTLEPQLSADAGYSQLTADLSAGQLPAAFQNLDLYSPYGPLVYANRGLLEFSDLLKRPPDTFKYLLGTTESGVLGMEHFLLHLDEVMIATSNEKQLDAFKESPDFESFKGRIEFVRVPYLREFRAEQAIYEDKLTQALVGGKHIAPHATEVAATWALLTRLKRPDPAAFPAEARGILEELKPLEKLRLYEEGRAPARLAAKEVERLEGLRGLLYREALTGDDYEGRVGASAREMQTALLNASQSARYACLSPQAVLDELRQLCREKSVFAFLQQPTKDGYQAPESFLQVVEEAYLDAVEEELRALLPTEQKGHSKNPAELLAREGGDEGLLERMCESFGYCQDCARETLAFLIHRRCS